GAHRALCFAEAIRFKLRASYSCRRPACHLGRPKARGGNCGANSLDRCGPLPNWTRGKPPNPDCQISAMSGGTADIRQFATVRSRCISCDKSGVPHLYSERWLSKTGLLAERGGVKMGQRRP